MIVRLDQQVGEIMEKLKERGLDDNTVIIFTSDNGPHEEGGADPDFFNRDGLLRGLKRSTYEGGIRIPFIEMKIIILPIKYLVNMAAIPKNLLA